MVKSMTADARGDEWRQEMQVLDAGPERSVSCCGLLKPKPKPFEQTIVIVRHSERVDFKDPAAYKASAEGQAWPFDTSITERGVGLAQEVAREMLEVHKKANFSVVCTSPYRRCMQTATEVAKLLKLPVLIDQEVGEVWEAAMPKERPPHRSPKELQEMAKELGIEVINPLLPEGGFKLFGKPPLTHPETVEMGHKRCIVRMETYIEQSAMTRQNFIIVSHAPAVAALMEMFERGQVDVEKLDYCARVIANRKLVERGSGKGSSAFKAQWSVECKGINITLNLDADEDGHVKTCQETEQMVIARKEKRTQTDMTFAKNLRNLHKEPE